MLGKDPENKNLSTYFSPSVYELVVWPNGKPPEFSFKILISKETNTIRNIKDQILSSKKIQKITYDKLKLFSHKGIELEEIDIPYLKKDPLIYLITDNKEFDPLNYFYEYKTIKPIKNGGFAEVSLAQNVLNNKKLVAIKKTNVQKFSTEELFNLSREGRLISNLDHKNIIKIYNFYTYDHYLFNIMEYARGGELSQLICNKSPIPEERIKNIFTQIFEAVKYIHSKGIIHRDLKINNVVFLDEEKTKVALIDFGISTFSNDYGEGGDVVKAGTLKYMPPELLVEGEKNMKVSNKVDMWAMGVILYLLYFKRFPFDGKSGNEIKKKIKRDHVCFPCEIKIRKSLIELINKLLEKDPWKRISCEDSSFAEYFNDNETDEKYFEIFDINDKKNNKRNQGRNALTVNDIKNLLDFSIGGINDNEKKEESLNIYSNNSNENNDLKPGNSFSFHCSSKNKPKLATSKNKIYKKMGTYNFK